MTTMVVATAGATAAATNHMVSLDATHGEMHEDARNQEDAKERHRQRALQWLRCMESFCMELRHFLHHHIPAHCDPWDYTDIPPVLVQHRADYPHLAASCLVACNNTHDEDDNKHADLRCIMREYMPGIPSDDEVCRQGIQRVQGLAMQTFAAICMHPSLGVFRCSESKSLDVRCPAPSSLQYFFERGLNMCLALGTEHTWMKLQKSKFY